MSSVGFHAGNLLAEIGAPSDVEAFFRAIKLHVRGGDIRGDLALVTDRLYRRTIALDQLDATREVMEQLAECFKQIVVDDTTRESLGIDQATSSLPADARTLGELFGRRFILFFESVIAARSF